MDVCTGVRICVNYQFALATSNRGQAALTNVSDRDRTTAGVETLRPFSLRLSIQSVALEARELA